MNDFDKIDMWEGIKKNLEDTDLIVSLVHGNIKEFNLFLIKDGVKTYLAAFTQVEQLAIFINGWKTAKMFKKE